MSPRVTVLMSVYNGELYLREAVDSILNQSFSDFEFLIIDDASTDSSLKILLSYHDPRIRIIKNEKNLGLTKSLNIGIKAAKGEYIARMDADDISYLERFEKQVSFLDNNPHIVLVGTSKQTIDKDGLVIGSYIALRNPQYQDFLKGNPINHGSVMIRAAILKDFSGYNELFKKCQDYALWLQIAKNHQLFNLPDILYKLRIHSNCVSLLDEESIYYHILAIRTSKTPLPKEIVDAINKSGIRQLRQYFTEEEWIYYHNSMAGRYLIEGNMKKAYLEYRNTFRIKPWNMRNTINLIRTLLGKPIYCASGRIYESTINFFRRITYNK